MWIQRLLPAAIGLVIVLALAGLRIADPVPLTAVREAGFSVIERLAPRRPPVETLVQRVEIDAWPWPRDRLAQLVQRLDELGASVIVLDLDLAGPDPLSPSRLAELVPELDPATLPDTDARLAEAIAGASVLLTLQPVETGAPLRLPAGLGLPLGSDATLSDLPVLEAARLPFQPLLLAADGLGVSIADETATPRQWPLLWRTGQTALAGLTLDALRIAQSGTPIILPQNSEVEASAFSIGVGRYSVPVSETGTLRLYLAPPGSRATVSASDLLTVGYRRLAPQIEGRIVLVGLVQSAADLDMDAQAIEQIATGQFLSRPDWGGPLELAGFAVFALLTLVTLLALGPLAGAGAALAGGAAIVTAVWLGFVTQGLLLDASFPMAGLLAVLLSGWLLFATLVDGPRRRLQALFEGRLSQQGISRLVARPDRLAPEGQTRSIIVLEARLIPAATPQRSAPHRLADIKTGVARLAQRVVASGGLVVPAAADRLLALWNAPLDTADAARKAALCALAMRQAGSFSAGLAGGEALVGLAGMGRGQHYGAIGDALDQADAMERAAGLVGYDLVLGEEMRGALADFALLDAGRPPMGPGGRREAVYLLVGDATMAKAAPSGCWHWRMGKPSG